MHDSIQPARLARSRRAHLLTLALLVSGVLIAGCTGGSSSSPAATTSAGSARTAAVSGCLASPASCYSPRVFRVAYGIQPLLERGIDGRGETVTVLAAPAAPGPPIQQCTGRCPTTSAGNPGPDTTDIRQDLKAFDSMFGLPAAPVHVVTTLAGAASPWQATDEEAQDVEMVHMVAPAASLRVVLMPANALASAATATADMLAGLRLAVSGTGVASIGWSLGEHFFTKAQVSQMHSILRGAAAHHVTVVANSGDNGAFSDAYGGTPVKEVSLPASDPLVLAVGGTTLTANPATGAYLGETVWNGETSFSQSSGVSGGGFSSLYARPAYQDGVPGISKARGVPDVASVADQHRHPGRHRRRPQDTDQSGLRHCRRRGAVGRAHRAGRPGRPPRPWPGQPRHLPRRPRLQLPPGLPRHHHRQQQADPAVSGRRRRVPRRPRMGSGNGLGNPQRPGARPPAGPLRQPQQDVAGSCGRAFSRAVAVAGQVRADRRR
jgi:hypothetical protein